MTIEITVLMDQLKVYMGDMAEVFLEAEIQKILKNEPALDLQSKHHLVLNEIVSLFNDIEKVLVTMIGPYQTKNQMDRMREAIFKYSLNT